MEIICVGLGGAIGAVLRYAISLLPYKGSFPMLTLITNVLGAILIGFITGYAAKKNLPQNLVLFLKTGVCGGFTTFSTFSLEAYSLMHSGSYILSIIYILSSLILCLGGIMIGMLLSNFIVKS